MRQANVTPRDITGSERYKPEKCPVASALKRIFRCTVQVHRNIVVLITTKIDTYKFSPSLTEWIKNYDQGKNIEQISLQIDDSHKYIFLRGEAR